MTIGIVIFLEVTFAQPKITNDEMAFNVNEYVLRLNYAKVTFKSR